MDGQVSTHHGSQCQPLPCKASATSFAAEVRTQSALHRPATTTRGRGLNWRSLATTYVVDYRLAGFGPPLWFRERHPDPVCGQLMQYATPLLAPIPLEECAGTVARFRRRSSNDELKTIASRLHLASVQSLTVEARVKAIANGAFQVDASLRASIVRSCVVTLEEFEESVEASFRAILGDSEEGQTDSDTLADREIVDREPLHIDGLPLGELAVQHLSLALDPYPRHPDAPPAGDSDWLEGKTESELASQLARIARSTESR